MVVLEFSFNLCSMVSAAKLCRSSAICSDVSSVANRVVRIYGPNQH